MITKNWGNKIWNWGNKIWNWGKYLIKNRSKWEILKRLKSKWKICQRKMEMSIIRRLGELGLVKKMWKMSEILKRKPIHQQKPTNIHNNLHKNWCSVSSNQDNSKNYTAKSINSNNSNKQTKTSKISYTTNYKK